MASNRRRSSWRLATGAGLEPASPACTGALAIELPCFILPLHCGLALLDVCPLGTHLGAAPMCPSGAHTDEPLDPFRMCPSGTRGVSPRDTGFCFLRPSRRGV